MLLLGNSPQLLPALQLQSAAPWPLSPAPADQETNEQLLRPQSHTQKKEKPSREDCVSYDVAFLHVGHFFVGAVAAISVYNFA